MPSISFYRPETGQITHYVEAPDNILAINKINTHWVEGKHDGRTEYVVNGAVTPRPDSPATLSGSTLENLPIPCTIVINGQSYECEDSTAELSFDQPGTYLVVVQCWPYLDKEFSVENPPL